MSFLRAHVHLCFMSLLQPAEVRNCSPRKPACPIWFDHILALESEPSPFASGLNLSPLQNVNEGMTYPKGFAVRTKWCLQWQLILPKDQNHLRLFLKYIVGFVIGQYNSAHSAC